MEVGKTTVFKPVVDPDLETSFNVILLAALDSVVVPSPATRTTKLPGTNCAFKQLLRNKIIEILNRYFRQYLTIDLLLI